MSAVDTFRDALFGNPPSSTYEPSREGALAAFTELSGLVDASLNGGPVLYEDTAAGIAATTDGEYFSVPSDDETYLTLYKNVSGAATEINTYPSSQALKDAIDALDAMEDYTNRAVRSPFQNSATFAGALTETELRDFILDVDLSDFTDYNPSRLYSFAIITKSATQVSLELYEQITSGVYPDDPPIPALIFEAEAGDGYVSTSKNPFKLTSALGVGQVAILPAALTDSDTPRSAMDYNAAGLDDHVFHEYGLIARTADRNVATSDDDGVLQNAYMSGIAYMHPNEPAEHVGDSNYASTMEVGQSHRFGDGSVVQKIETGIFTAGGQTFKGKMRVYRSDTLASADPSTATLIEEFDYPAGSYSDITLTLSEPAFFKRNECIRVYAVPDATYAISIRIWDHPRAGDPNPNKRTPIMFRDGSGWSFGGVTSSFAYYQVPLRLWTNVLTRDDILGNDGGYLFGAGNIREFPRWRARLIDGAPIALHVAFGPADSYTEDDAWTTRLARAWKSEMGNGGSGWTGVGFPSSEDGSSNAAKAAAATGNVDSAEMAISFTGTGWTGEYTRVIESPDLCAATSSTAGDRITFTHGTSVDETSVRGHFLGGSGVSRYRFNGGSWTTLNLSGTNGQRVDLVGAPAGAWTLDWEVVSGTCKFFGIVTRTGLPGIIVHDLANNGSALCNWARMGEATPAADRARIVEAWALMGPVRTVISPIGPNDQGQQWTYDQFADALDLTTAMVQAAWPGADYLHVAAPENGRDPATYPYRMRGYTAKAKLQTGIAVLDMQPLFGSNYSAYGDTGTDRQLFEADLLHPNTEGGYVYGPSIYSALRYRS